MKEERLRKLWEKYINIPLYRIVPTSDLVKIMEEGIDPKQNPYEKIKPLVNKFKKIIEDLEKKGKIIFLQWGNLEVSGVYVLEITLQDLSLNCVDFTPDKELIPYYMNLRGGAATANLSKLIARIEEKGWYVSQEDAEVLRSLKHWVEKRSCENRSVYVLGNSKVFETALFQRRKKNKSEKRTRIISKKYLESPFGSFEHFRNIVTMYGFEEYSIYLKSKLFFLRVKEKIPKEEIIVL